MFDKRKEKIRQRKTLLHLIKFLWRIYTKPEFKKEKVKERCYSKSRRTKGSVEAIRQSLEKLSTDNVKVK